MASIFTFQEIQDSLQDGEMKSGLSQYRIGLYFNLSFQL